MRYLPSKIHSLSNIYFPLLAVFLLGIFLNLFDIKVPVFLTQITRAVAQPIWSVRDGVKMRAQTFLDSGKSYDEVVAHNTELEGELIQLRRENVAARAAIADIEDLQKLAGRVTDEDGLISASIILDHKSSPYDLFIIDSGSKNGVRKDMLVVTTEGIALGFITSVSDNTSTVTLFSAPKIQTGVVLVGSSTLHAMLEGVGGGMMLRVPRDMSVVVGTFVMLPSFSGNMVGEVVHVDIKPEDAFQTVYVASPINIYTSRYVLVDSKKVWSPYNESKEAVVEETAVDENDDEQ